MSKKVAIVGAGRTGICAAKQALDADLLPTVFDKNKVAGGLWIPPSEGGVTWNTMHCNATRYLEQFADFPWPDGTQMFPTTHEMHQYILAYMRYYKLEPYIRLNTVVEKIDEQIGQWQLTYLELNTNKRATETFDYLIVASGLHWEKHVPRELLKNRGNFNGHVIHSSEFMDRERFRDKKVVIIGCSKSAMQLCEDLVHVAKPPIVIAYRRPYLVVPRLFKLRVKGDLTNKYRIIPMDFVLFSQHFDSLTEREEAQLYTELCPEQTDKSRLVLADLYYDLSSGRPFRVTLADNLVHLVRAGLVKPRLAELEQYEANGVRFKDGSREDNVDVVILCTGFINPRYSFFERTASQKLGLDAITTNFDKDRNSILLYRYTFHPEFTNLAFISPNVFSFFCGCELQAKWACRVFSGEIQLPPKSVMEELMLAEHNILVTYPKFVKQIAIELNLWPNGKQMPDFLVSDQFSCKQSKLAQQMMREINEILNREYSFDGDDDGNNQKKVAEMFSQFYKVALDIYK